MTEATTLSSSAPATAPASAPAASPSTVDWRSSLPADLQSEKSLESFKDVGGLARSFVDTIKMRGAPASEFLRMPRDDAGWETALKALGRPDKADGYTWKAPDTVKIADDVIAYHREAAHKAGMLPRQYDAFMSNLMQAEQGRSEAAGKARNEEITRGMADLQGKWKDKYPAELETAKEGYGQLFPEALREKIKAAGLENDPLFIEVMNNVGKSYTEDKNRQGGTMNFNTRDLPTVKTERLATMAKLKGMDGMNPEFKILNDKVTALFQEEAELAYAQGYGRPKDLKQED